MKTTSPVIRRLAKLYRGVLRRTFLSPERSRGCSGICRCGTLRFEPLESRELLSATNLGTLDPGEIGTVGAVGALIYEADFEGNVGGEWSDTRLDATSAEFTSFLGRFGNESVTATLPTEPGKTYGLLYDLAIIDSWDGNEPFRVYVDGQTAVDARFHYNGGTPDLRGHYGWSGWTDSLYRDFGIHFTADAATTTVSFAASGLQELSDESWGIDNVRLYERVPGPTVDAVEPSGHSADAGEPIVITLSEVSDPGSARDAGGYALVNLGEDKAPGGGNDTVAPVLPDFRDGTAEIALRPASDLAENWDESDYFMDLGLLGEWVVASDGATVRQDRAGGASFFVSGDAWQSDRFAGRISVDPGAADDDAIGLVLGFETDGAGEPLSYYLVSWRAAAQDGASAGVTLARVSGNGAADPDLWTLDDADSDIEVLAAAPAVLWQPGGEYDFVVARNSATGSFTITLSRADTGSGLVTLSTPAGSLPGGLGNVGFYCHSQSGVTFAAEKDGGRWSDGAYQLTVRNVLTNLEGIPLDGDADGFAGGDYSTTFEIDTTAPVVLGANYGANQIYVTFDDFGGMDPGSVTDPAKWRLWAAGGDDSFGEGNETDASTLIQSIVWEPSIGVATLSLADGTLESELYELRVWGVTDLAGNVLEPPAEPIQFRGEDLLADTVVWKPVTGGDWGVAENWSTGVLPGPTDRVVIAQPGIEVSVSGDVSVLRIHSAADLRIHSGTFRVLGNSQLTGALFVAGGAAIKAEGPAAVLSAVGATTLDGANLYALSGGQLLLDTLTEYLHASTGNNQDRVIQATGAGSMISLAGLTQVFGGTHYDCDLTISATDGGRIAMPSTTIMESPLTGDQRHRGIHVTAEGNGSTIDLSGLERFQDYQGWESSTNHDGQLSQLKALAGGEIVLGSLTHLRGVDLTLDGSGSIDLNSLEWTQSCRFDIGMDISFPSLWKAESGYLYVSGAEVTLPEVTDINRISIYISGGGGLSIPKAVSYQGETTSNRDDVWEVTGAGSTLSLSALAEIHGGTQYDCDLTISALSGGRIDMPNVTAISAPAGGDQRYRGVFITADGEGSVVDMSSLERFEDAYGWTDGTNHPGQMSQMNVLPGGDILLPAGELLLTNVDATVGGVLLADLRLAGNTVLGGSGRVDGSVAATGSSVIRPGKSTVGTLEISGDLAQGSGAALELQLGGVDPGMFDRLLVGGTATLAGGLSVSLAGGFFPADADAFEVLTAATRSGVFSTYAGLDLGGGSELSPGYSATTVTLNTEFSTGPRVEGISPAGDVVNELAQLVVTFSEVIQPSSLTAGDILFEGPNGPITVTSILPTGDRGFRLVFPRQTAEGDYELRLGSDVLDLVGNPMNQDGDGINGEAYVDPADPGDVFVHTFFLDDQAGPVVAALSPVGLTNQSVSSIQLRFNEPINPATLTAASLRLAAGPGALEILAINSADAEGKRFDVSVAPLSADGQYTLELLPGVEDIHGNAMGQKYTAQFTVDQTGPAVVSMVPGGPTAEVVNSVTITFDASVADSTLDLSDFVLTDPAGLPVVLSAPVKVSASSYRLSFDPRRANGEYRLVVGPDIEDLAGNDMTINAAGPFHGSFTITLPDLVVLEDSQVLAGSHGQDVAISWTIRNDGTLAATDTRTQRIYLSADTALDGADFLIWQRDSAVDPLPAGQSEVVNETITLPQDLSLPEGSYYLLVAADATGTITETDESNTAVVGTMEITLPDLADLVVRDVLADAVAHAGQTLNVSWIVDNLGAAGADGSWRTRISLVGDGLSGGRTVLATFDSSGAVGGLESQPLPQSAQVTIPALGTSGELTVEVELLTNGAGDVFEIDPENNTALAEATTTVPSKLLLAFPAITVAENGAALRSTVTRTGVRTEALVVTLTSNDTGELTVPPSVTIPAGQSSAVFYATPVNDGAVDPNAQVTVTAAAAGHVDGAKSIEVRNVQTPALSVEFSVSELTEGAPDGADQFTITITRDYVTDDALLVGLTASQSGQISLPAFVTIPAGKAFVTIDSYAYNDQTPEKTESVGIAATASGWQSGDTYLTLHDDDIPGLSVVLDATVMSEGGGTQALAGTVSRDEVSNVDIRVRFSSSDTTEAYVPRDVIIRAGQTSATFYIAAIDDDLVDGTQTVTLTASIIVPSCGCGVDPYGEEVTATFDVLDNDGPTLTLDLEPRMTAEGVVDAVTATVWRNTPTDEDLIVTLESSDESEMVAPPTVTILAGSSQASIKLDTVQDDVVDGDQTVTITASVEGYTSGIGQVIVTDRDLPDLVIDAIQTPAGAVHTNSTFDITYRVENRGLSEAISVNADPDAGFEGSWIDRVFLSDDPYVGDDILIGSYTYTGTLSNVDGANGYQRTVSIDAPFETGDYWVVVQTDLGADVHEGLETNNAKIIVTPVHVSAAYSATVQTDVTVAPAGTPIQLTGQALDADSGDAIAYAQVNIHIRLRGYNRVVSAICDENGAFQTTWMPLPTEAGQYTIGACHPGQTSAPVQDSFTLVGMKAETASRTITVIEGSSATSSVTLRNLSDVPLTGVTVEVLNVAENLTVDVAPVSTFLGGSGTQTASFTVSATDASVLNSSFTLRVSSAEAPSVDIPVSVSITALKARLSANPGTLTAGMLRGEQTLVEFTVTNTGGKATGPIDVMLPEVSWMHLVSDAVMASLEPGESAPVTVQLTPPADMDLTQYKGNLALWAEETRAAASIPYSFRAISDQTGDVTVVAIDELYYYGEGQPALAGASVILRDALSNVVIKQGTTNEEGQVVLHDIPQGYYLLDVSADRHGRATQTIFVNAETVNPQTVFLSRQLVEYTWTVREVEIEDRYEIVIETEFETNVPAPVVVMEGLVDFSNVPEVGQTWQTEFKFANHGWIAVHDLVLKVPSHPFYTVTPLITDIGTLPAKSELVIPVIVQRVADYDTLDYRQTAWINEIHYDNIGEDIGEGFGIAGLAGTDLTGWRIAFYDGQTGRVMEVIDLTGIIDYSVEGVWFDKPDMSNDLTGMALIAPNGHVTEFISYEGAFHAVDGPAAGQKSNDMQVAEDESTPADHSLQRTGANQYGTNSTWAAATHTAQSGDSVTPYGPVPNVKSVTSRKPSPPAVPCYVMIEYEYEFECGPKKIKGSGTAPTANVDADCPSAHDYGDGGTWVLGGGVGSGGSGGGFGIAVVQEGCNPCLNEILDLAFCWVPVPCAFGGAASCGFQGAEDVLNGTSEGSTVKCLRGIVETCLVDRVGGPVAVCVLAEYRLLKCFDEKFRFGASGDKTEASSQSLGVEKADENSNFEWGGEYLYPSEVAVFGPDDIDTSSAGPLAGYAFDFFEAVIQLATAFEPLAYFVGDMSWLQQAGTDVALAVLDAYVSAIVPSSDAGIEVSADELNTVTGLVPADTPGAESIVQDLNTSIARWNRSMEYWSQGWYAQSDVPSGYDTDFIEPERWYIKFASRDAIIQQLQETRGISPVAAFDYANQALAQAAETIDTSGVCANVRLRLEQEVIMSRDAFQATLELNNKAEVPLESVLVNVRVTDLDGVDCTDLFGINEPSLENFTSVDGTGLLQAKTLGISEWLIVPTHEAAADGPTRYIVTGTLQYSEYGKTIEVPLSGVTITVLPQSELDLDYFWQRDVIADDPWTDEVEPSVPFELAVLIQNYGAGEARNLRIESGQPQIIENDKGLLIDFNIIGSELDGEPMQPSLNLNFGNIAPGDTTVGRWFMTSSLLGHFTEYEATFRHLDGLGDDRLSLIKDVDIHELIHTVYVTGDLDDGKSDFLVNELADGYDLPDTLYLSDGSVADVTQAENISADGVVTPDDYVIELSVDATEGWTYFRLDDPGAADYEVVRVVRRDADGREADLPADNFWQTHYTFIGGGLRPVEEDILHLFDYGAAAGYTLYYEPRDQVGPVVVTFPIFRDLSNVDPEVAALLNVRSLVQEEPVESIEIEFSKAIDPATFTRDDLALVRDQSDNLITPSVTVERIDATRYRIGGLATLNEETGDYALVIYTEGIQDTFGNDGAGVWSTGWMRVGDAPLILAVAGAPIGARSTPVESITITFSEPIDLGTFGPDDISLRHDEGGNLLTAPLEVVQIAERIYRLDGLGDLTLGDGEYDLLIDMADVTDLDGAAGEGEWWINWTMDGHPPEIAEIRGAEEAVRNTSPDSMTVRFSESIQTGSFSTAALALTRDGAPILLDGIALAPLGGGEYRVTGLASLTAEEGHYRFTVDAATIRDTAGNAGTGSLTVSWTLDTNPPAAATSLAISPDTGLNATDGATTADTLILSGSLADATASVTVYDETTGTDLGSATVAGLSFSKQISFTSPGTHRLKVRAADAAGNTADSYFTVFIDRNDLTIAAWTGVPSAPVEDPVSELTITFSHPIDPASFALGAVELMHEGTSVHLVSAGASLTPVSDTEYRLGNLPNLHEGTYVLSIDTTRIAKRSSGRTGAGIETAGWTMADVRRPTVEQTRIQDGGSAHLAVDHFSVTFSEPMNVQELLDSDAIAAAVRLTRGLGQMKPAVETVDLSLGTFTWDSVNRILAWQAGAEQTLSPGWYELQLDSDLFQDLAGNRLLGDGTAWTPFGVARFGPAEALTLSGGGAAAVTSYSAPAFGDYNGDGLTDLIVGEKSADGQGRIVVFLNMGTASAPSFAVGETIPVVVAGSGCLGASPAWTDWDGDGASDLLVGTAGGGVVFFRNTGTPGAPAFAAAEPVSAGPAGAKFPIAVGARAMIDVADLDGNGRDDLIVGDLSGRIQVFYDLASSGMPDLVVGRAVQVGGAALSVPSGRAAPVAVDFDGDGRLDLLAGNTEGQLWLYRNAGTAAEPAFLGGVPLTLATGEAIDIPGTPRSRPTVADLSGDGVLDVLIGSQDGSLLLHEGQAPAENDVTHFTIFQPMVPSLTSLRVGDGSSQRSMVRSIELVFEPEVVLLNGALRLLDGTGAQRSLAVNTVDYQTYTITFADPGLTGESLMDGWYRFIVDADKIRNSSGAMLAADVSQDFSRLFGDSDGDLDVDAADMDDFNAAHATHEGDPGFDAAFDADGDGYIGAFDLAAILQNDGTALVPSYADAMQEYAAEMPGDLNGDGVVGSADLDVIRAKWGRDVERGILYEGDASGDGLVGSADLDIVRANWGRSLPTAAAAQTDPQPSRSAPLAAGTPVYGPVRKEDAGRAALSDAALATWEAADVAWADALDALILKDSNKAKTAKRREAADMALLAWME